MPKSFWISIFSLLLIQPLFAYQEVYVRSIRIQGNQKTKDFIITREMAFQVGDTIVLQEAPALLSISENQIFNTSLFTDVTIRLVNWDSNWVDAEVMVSERWYTWPIPLFELADRNFNVWWQEMGRDFSRTHYGINFYQENVRGRNETLHLKAQLGFTEKFEVFYTIPYVNKKRRLGLEAYVHTSRNKQIGYKTEQNKLLFYEGTSYVQDRFYTGMLLSYRKKIFSKHLWNVAFHKNQILDTAITDLNPHYFLEGRQAQVYFTLRYHFIYDQRDIRYYPLSGQYIEINAEQIGFSWLGNVNLTALSGAISGYRSVFTNKVYGAIEVKGKISAPTQQPYYNQQGFGYHQNYVRGYELSVIDGQHYFLSKQALKYELLSSRPERFKISNASQLKGLNLGIYPKLYMDIGYVSDDFYTLTNQLNNTWLLGGGIGVDFVTFYDTVFRVEYSTNKEGKSGLFLHFKSHIQ